MKRTTLIVAAAAAALIVTGCGRKAEHTVVRTPNGVVTASQGSGGVVNYNVNGANGSHAQMTFGGGSAAALPAFLPIFPGSKVMTSVVGGDANGGGGMVMLTVKAKPEDIIAFYKEKTKGAGFAETSTISSSGSVTFGAAKGDGKQSVAVTASPSGDETAVTLNWSNPKAG